MLLSFKNSECIFNFVNEGIINKINSVTRLDIYSQKLMYHVKEAQFFIHLVLLWIIT